MSTTATGRTAAGRSATGEPSRPWRTIAMCWAVGVTSWALVAGTAIWFERSLRNGAVVTGYALFALMLVLSLFNLRKRLLVLPVGTVRSWMIAHGVIGVLAIPIYFQHTGTLWPGGFYEQIIAIAFYAATLSGIAGYALERILPRRLAHLGGEIIQERIPGEIAELRARAEALVLKAVADTGSDTLGRYYAESLDWYFWRPRFLLSHLVGGGRALRWIEGHLVALRRYLNEAERERLDALEALALRKNRLDAHHALQSVLKLWLFVHIPAAVLLVALAAWHLLVVNIYAR
ncbi:MAG TPA: hypothetical protein VIS77_16040 [Burkholderiales bacterium]